MTDDTPDTTGIETAKAARIAEEAKLEEAKSTLAETSAVFSTLKAMRLENNWAKKARKALGARHA